MGRPRNNPLCSSGPGLPAVIDAFVRNSSPSDEEREAYLKDRATALDEEGCKLILRLLASGNFLEPSVKAAGISLREFKRWKSRWKKGDPPAQKLDWFFSKLEQAIALAEITTLEKLRSGAPGWQAQAWALERRFGDRWRMKRELPLLEPHQVEPPKPIEDMTEQELADYNQKLAAHAKVVRQKAGPKPRGT